MALISPLVDYTDKDYASLRRRLRNLIRSVFPEWTDFNVADFGNILVELFAHTGDVVSFYQDNQARQSRITTATQRKALLGLVKLIGYIPSTATAATAALTITLDGPVQDGATMTFPAGAVVRTADVVNATRYQLLEAAVLSAGEDTVAVEAEHSESKEQSFLSSGLPNQVLSLGSTPYIDSSAVVVAGNGGYTQVVNFLDSTPTDRHYTVVVDQNDRASLAFGNGVNGAIPLGTITTAYKIGGGVSGRVEMNKLKVFENSTWLDSLGAPVSPTVTNADVSSGGTDRQSVAQIKERAPASVRVLNRTVAREDFEINALRLPAVARALMLTSNEDPGEDENAGSLYIVPVGGGDPTQVLKDAVLAQVTTVYPRTLTFSVDVKDALYFDLDLLFVVHARAGVNKATMAAAIRAALVAYFAVQNSDGTTNTNVDFGANMKDGDGVIDPVIALSDVMNVVRDTAGVRKLGPFETDFTINGAHNDVTIAVSQFPRLGDVLITDGDTGDSL